MQTIHLSRTDPDAFHSLQEAVLAIPDDRSEPVRILVSPGIYEEKVWIRKENLEIIGEQPENTIFRYGDGARKPRPDGSGEYGTSTRQSCCSQDRTFMWKTLLWRTPRGLAASPDRLWRSTRRQTGAVSETAASSDGRIPYLPGMQKTAP